MARRASRDLHRRLPDLAVDAHDQHGLARLRNAGAAQALHRRDKGNADAGGLLQAKALWVSTHCNVGLGQVRGIGAVRRMPRSPDEPNTSLPIRSQAHRFTTHAVAAGRARNYRMGHQAGRKPSRPDGLTAAALTSSQ